MIENDYFWEYIVPLDITSVKYQFFWKQRMVFSVFGLYIYQSSANEEQTCMTTHV